MAQLLFDALTGGVSGIDSQAVLAVQSLLDAQNAVGAEGVIPTSEDDDVFQCGKCKKQFTSLPVFMTHKKEHCNASVVTTAPAVSQNTLVVRKVQIPSSPLATISPGVVLTEADLFSLTANIDQPIATISACPTIQTASTSQSSPLSSVSASDASLPNSIQQVEAALLSPSQPPPPQQQAGEPHTHTVGFSLITNTLVSTPLLVANQPSPPTSGSNMVVSISQPVQNKELPAQSGPQTASLLSKGDSVTLETVPVEINVGSAPEIPVVAKKNFASKDGSTVNIIKEFHTSMVRSRKRDVNNENNESSEKKGNILNCAYCTKEFTKNFDLQQHIRCHTGEKPFQCIVCGRAFAQKSNVKKHMQTHKVWPDGLAHTLPYTSQIQKENSSGSDTTTAAPKDINHNSVNENISSEHSSTSEGAEPVSVNNNYSCPYCDFTGKTYFELKTHMTQHKREKVYKCILSSCGQMFQELDLFLEHTKCHENEMLYRCHQCNKTFKSLFDLGSHQYSHSLYPNQGSRTQQRYFRCSRCLNKYSTPAALEHHMATSPHNYMCRFCEKVFPCERYLRRHLHTHGSTDLHICKHCSKGFKTEHYLKVHLLIHSGEKPFRCHQCNACFNRRDKLKRHFLVHEPVKRFKCPFRTHSGCPKEFNRVDKLKAHILTHSFVKPFLCKLCGRTFTRKSHLKDHERIHTEGQKFPFSCDHCGQGFEHKKNLSEHKCSEPGRRYTGYKIKRPGRPRRNKLIASNNS